MTIGNGLQPVKIFSEIVPGGEYKYQSVMIKVTPQCEIKVDGCQDPVCVPFSRMGGIGAYWRGFVVQHNGRLLIFEGAGLGSGIISKEQVLQTCGMSP